MAEQPWSDTGSRHLIRDTISPTMNFELSDDEKTALLRELDRIIQDDRYLLSPRIQMLKAILGKLRPEPVREPLPEVKHYEPPSKGRYSRRR